jgi:hypothetical protein
MTAAVKREVYDPYFFSLVLMCRPWGIRLKRGRNEVCINSKRKSPWVTSSAGRMRGHVDLDSLMTTSSRACFQIPTLPPNRNTARHSTRKDFEKKLCTVPALSTRRGKNVKSPGNFAVLISVIRTPLWIFY